MHKVLAALAGPALAIGLVAAPADAKASAKWTDCYVSDAGVQCTSPAERNASSTTMAVTSDVLIAKLYQETGYNEAAGGIRLWKASGCTTSYSPEEGYRDLAAVGFANQVESIHTYAQCDVKLFDHNYPDRDPASVWIDQSSNLHQIGTGWGNRANWLVIS